MASKPVPGKSEKKAMDIICIVCPNGCHLTVENTQKGAVVVGNKCVKGEKYGRDEVTDPRRVVTAVVKTSSSLWPCVPVKSVQALPKKVIPKLLKILYAMQVQLPIQSGDVIIKNFADTGIDIVATRTLK